MNTTLLKKWAPVLLSAAVTLFAGFQSLISGAHGPSEIAQFLALIATTITTGVVPLLDTRWQGILKTGLEIVGVVLVAVLPFWISGGITWSNGILIVVAVMKALATHFGVVLRTSSLIDTRNSADAVPVLTTVPAGTLAGGDALTAGDGLSDPANAATPATVTIAADDDVPKHLATS